MEMLLPMILHYFQKPNQMIYKSNYGGKAFYNIYSWLNVYIIAAIDDRFILTTKKNDRFISEP